MKGDMEKMYLEEKKTKDSIIHDLKSRIDTLNSQLTLIKKENEDLQIKLEEKVDDGKNQEINNLIHDNTILNEE